MPVGGQTLKNRLPVGRSRVDPWLSGKSVVNQMPKWGQALEADIWPVAGFLLSLLPPGGLSPSALPVVGSNPAVRWLSAAPGEGLDRGGRAGESSDDAPGEPTRLATRRRASLGGAGGRDARAPSGSLPPAWPGSWPTARPELTASWSSQWRTPWPRRRAELITAWPLPLPRNGAELMGSSPLP